MKNGCAVGRIVLSVLVASCAAGELSASDVGVYGRVRISVVEDDDQARVAAVQSILESRVAPAPGRAFADLRLISVRPREGDADRFDVTLYDYSAEEAFDVVFDASGAEISRKPFFGQPGLADGELEDAMSILALDASLSKAIAAGAADFYAPMPPVVTGDDGTRLVNVGVRTRRPGQLESVSNEIVSVHIPTGRITRYAANAPPTSLATLANCGPGASSCGGGSASCATYHYEWPAASPLWKFDVLHPSCTRSIQSDGTGLELQNVRYLDRLVLARADMPVLNVKYANDSCGPYRDWLYQENCFQATGTTVSPGILVTGASAPTSFCDTNSDAGAFRGIAIDDEGDVLRLVTETEAGWYRYVMEWRLHLDGTIEPVFGFGAVSNSCTCNEHHHHAYWRFEFALDGVTGNGATGICTLDRRTPGTSTQWTAVSAEGSFVRPTSDPTSDSWRVRNPTTGTTYVIDPGPNDGTASGDSYAKADVWALAANANEINDSETSDTSIRIDPWVNGEALGAGKRLVLWYRAGYDHDHDTTGDDCHLAGPTLHFERTCPAIVTLDRGTYGCNDGIAVKVEDDDLIGAGTLSVTVRSAIESTPESIVLHETPAGSGDFTGTVPTRPPPAVAGDGKVSVGGGDTVTVTYLDVSSCGTPNVSVAETASIECTPPVISNVQVTGLSGGNATITWTTNELSTSVVTYGPGVPPSSVLQSSALTTSHSLLLTGLAPCGTYHFSVASTDGFGNAATDDHAGAFYAFTTPSTTYSLGPESVESGAGSWTVSGTAAAAWHIDTCRSGSPTHAWKAGAPLGSCAVTYANFGDTYLTSAVFALGAPGHGRHLQFGEYYQTEQGYDFCRVQISVNGGSSWTNLAEYSGTSAAWALRDIDLAPYSGSNVRIRFWLNTDDTVVGEGWIVDDIAVSGTGSCTASVVESSQTVSPTCSAGGTPDATVDPGEIVSVQVVARNAGGAPASGISGSITTTTPGVTILDGTASFPNLGPGASGAGATPFRLAVGTSVPCATPIALSLRFTANEGSWTQPIAIPTGVAGGAPVSRSWSSTDTPKPLADFPVTTTSTIHVVDPGTVVDVNVPLAITHTYDGDLDMFLIGPNGTRVELTTDNGVAGHDFTGTIFDDEAATSIIAGTPPYTGSFRPETPLSVLDGVAIGGDWTLESTDDGEADIGTLLSWSIAISALEPSCTSCAPAQPTQEASLVRFPSRTVLTWNPAPGAAWHEIDRGTGSSLPALLTSAADSCRLAGSGTTSPAAVTETPAVGSFYWYLVIPASTGGLGPAGAASSGPRVLDGTGDCP